MRAAGRRSPISLRWFGTTPLLAAAGTDVPRETRPQDPVADPESASGTPTAARPESRVLEAVQLLLASGSDANEANQAGNTAMYFFALSVVFTLFRFNPGEPEKRAPTPKTTITIGSIKVVMFLTKLSVSVSKYRA